MVIFLRRTCIGFLLVEKHPNICKLLQNVTICNKTGDPYLLQLNNHFQFSQASMISLNKYNTHGEKLKQV